MFPLVYLVLVCPFKQVSTTEFSSRCITAWLSLELTVHNDVFSKLYSLHNTAMLSVDSLSSTIHTLCWNIFRVNSLSIHSSLGAHIRVNEGLWRAVIMPHPHDWLRRLCTLWDSLYKLECFVLVLLESTWSIPNLISELMMFYFKLSQITTQKWSAILKC